MAKQSKKKPITIEGDLSGLMNGIRMGLSRIQNMDGAKIDPNILPGTIRTTVLRDSEEAARFDLENPEITRIGFNIADNLRDDIERAKKSKTGE